MKIEFNLSSDQFLEWQSFGRRQRESRVPLIVIISLLFLAVGYLVARPATDRGGLIGSTMIGVGLALPFIAVLVWLVQKRRNPEKNRTKLLSAFGRFYSGQRSFEADGSGWKFVFEQSQDVRAWSSLVLVAKTQELYVMQDAYTSYALPKAAMTAEEQKTLLELCERALLPNDKLWSVSMVAEPQDYVSAMIRDAWWQTPWKMLGLCGAGMACIWLLTLIVADAYTPFPTPVSIFLILSLPILSLPILQGVYYHQRFQTYRKRSYQIVEIAEDRVCFLMGTLRETREIRVVLYRWLHKVRESRRVLMLYLHPTLVYLIPKANFKAEELAKFRELLRSHKEHQSSN